MLTFWLQRQDKEVPHTITLAFIAGFDKNFQTLFRRNCNPYRQATNVSMYISFRMGVGVSRVFCSPAKLSSMPMARVRRFLKNVSQLWTWCCEWVCPCTGHSALHELATLDHYTYWASCSAIKNEMETKRSHAAKPRTSCKTMHNCLIRADILRAVPYPRFTRQERCFRLCHAEHSLLLHSIRAMAWRKSEKVREQPTYSTLNTVLSHGHWKFKSSCEVLRCAVVSS